MRGLILFILFVAAVLSLALATTPAAAESAFVDRADFFSADAEKQALENIAELERKHKVEVRVETFETVPAGDVERVKKMSAKERGEYFADWLKKLAHERKAEGVFILACREPSHLRIGVGKHLHARGFTDQDRDAATQRMMAAFKEKQYDKGLLGALDSIHNSVERHVKSAAAGGAAATRHVAAAEPDSMFPAWAGWACLIVGGIVAVIALVSVVGAMFRGGGAGAPGGGGYGYGGGGGGGFFGPLLGGLGGALLGNWMYDQWSGGSAHASDAGHHGDNDQHHDNDDFGSSGGDFGDSGGGDFGGDSGGGDFGGGDSGGGDF